MKFLPVEICKKLIEMGCKSISESFYDPDEDNDLVSEHSENFFSRRNEIPAFCLEDFVGSHEQAKENADIIWKDCMEPVVLYQSMRNIIGCKSPISYRHAMIDSPDWIEYLTNSIKKDE